MRDRAVRCAAGAVRITVAAFAVGPVALAQAPVPPGPFRLESDFFVLPAGRPIGSTAGIAVDSDGRTIWVFDRCGASDCVGSEVAPIMHFDAGGHLVDAFGAGLFVRPHGIYVDAEHNVWVTDGEGPNGEDPRRAGKGHQVFKFSPRGELLMRLGTPGVPGEGPREFNQPSAVIVASDGSVFVADGHGGQSNARVVKFSAAGAFVKAWGQRGTAPGEFNTPHGLAIDSQGRLFVADRGNNRIQIFDQEGNFLEEWKQFGNPSGIYIDAQDTLYVSEIGRNPEQSADWQQGIRIGSARDGRVVAFIPDAAPTGSSQEGVAADIGGNVYASLTRDMALRRYVPQ